MLLRMELLPSRVLDTGDSKNSKSLRLYMSYSGKKARYVTSSYCWSKVDATVRDK
jgi:hypothetical protein